MGEIDNADARKRQGIAHNILQAINLLKYTRSSQNLALVNSINFDFYHMKLFIFIMPFKPENILTPTAIARNGSSTQASIFLSKINAPFQHRSTNSALAWGKPVMRRHRNGVI